jgi:hypothetical protein
MIMTQDAPLSADEFNKLARTGHLVLPPERDNVAIHNYLRLERGWKIIWTQRYPEEDAGGARIEINAEFP